MPNDEQTGGIAPCDPGIRLFKAPSGLVEPVAKSGLLCPAYEEGPLIGSLVRSINLMAAFLSERDSTFA
jgi:hypothetical protein